MPDAQDSDPRNNPGGAGDEATDVPPVPELGDMTGWLVAPDHVRIWEDDFKVLHVAVGDETFADVRPRRVFPLSSKADYVSFMSDKGKEVLLLARPPKLDRKSRRVLEHALARTYYSARILRVYEIKESMGVSHWKVLTDRGFAAFEVVDRNSHIRCLPPARYLIMDADGNRFEIENLADLDAHSQAEVHHET